MTSLWGKLPVIDKPLAAQVLELQKALDAKDAEIAELRAKADKWRGFVEVMSDQVNDFIAKLKQAENDNRALREEVRTLRPEFPRLSVAAQEAAYRAGTKAIEDERDEARECVGRLWRALSAAEPILKFNAVRTPNASTHTVYASTHAALAATPENLR